MVFISVFEIQSCSWELLLLRNLCTTCTSYKAGQNHNLTNRRFLWNLYIFPCESYVKHWNFLYFFLSQLLYLYEQLSVYSIILTTILSYNKKFKFNDTLFLVLYFRINTTAVKPVKNERRDYSYIWKIIIAIKLWCLFSENGKAIKVCFIKVSARFFFVLKTYLVWTQSIGFPTYCLVVTAIENVTNNTTVAFVCSRNTAESIFTWFTYDIGIEHQNGKYRILLKEKCRK